MLRLCQGLQRASAERALQPEQCSASPRLATRLWASKSASKTAAPVSDFPEDHLEWWLRAMRALESSESLRSTTKEILMYLDCTHPLGVDVNRDGIALTPDTSIYNVTLRCKREQCVHRAALRSV